MLDPDYEYDLLVSDFSSLARTDAAELEALCVEHPSAAAAVIRRAAAALASGDLIPRSKVEALVEAAEAVNASILEAEDPSRVPSVRVQYNDWMRVRAALAALSPNPSTTKEAE